MKIMVILWSTSVAKDSNIVPSLFFSHFLSLFWAFSLFLWPFSFLGPSLFLWPFFFLGLLSYGLSLFFFFLLLTWDNALENDDHHNSIYLQLNDYNSMLEQKMTLYECLQRCTGIWKGPRVTCMKELWTVALPQILCQLHDHAKQYDNDECVMIKGMVESCMAIYLGMAMEMP